MGKRVLNIEHLATSIALLDAVCLFIDDHDISSAKRSLKIATRRLEDTFNDLAACVDSQQQVFVTRG